MNLNDKIDKIEETIIGSDYFEGKTSCNKDDATFPMVLKFELSLH